MVSIYLCISTAAPILGEPAEKAKVGHGPPFFVETQFVAISPPKPWLDGYLIEWIAPR